MRQPFKAPKKKTFLLIPSLFGIAVLAVVFSAGGFAFAASQESRDSFCASCHTEPETTYYQRSTSSQPIDLASFHTTQKTLCIDCHSGRGITGRLGAELMGARNAAKWYTGTAAQPAVLTFAIGDQNCLKCHQDVTQRGYVSKEQITLPGLNRREGEGEEEEGGSGHWHTFMARWQSAAPGAGSCVTCHAGHITGSSAQSGFMNTENVRAACDECHRVLRRGRD